MQHYNKHNLAVKSFASKSLVKPELNAVLFRKDRTVATDSFRLIEVTTPGTEYPEFDDTKNTKAPRGDVLIPTHTLADVKMPAKVKTLPGCDQVTLEVSSKNDKSVDIVGRNIVDAKTTRNTIQVVDGVFPEYEDILTSAEKKARVEVKVNVRYLLDVARVIGAMKPDFGVVTMSIAKDTSTFSPIIFTAEGGDKQKVRALIMPMNR